MCRSAKKIRPAWYLVSSLVKRFFLLSQNDKSPPSIRSITRKSSVLEMNAYLRHTMKGELMRPNIMRSFQHRSPAFFIFTRRRSMVFIAYKWPVVFRMHP